MRIGVWPQSWFGELWGGIPVGPRDLCRCSSHRHQPHALPVFGAVCKPVVSIPYEVLTVVLNFFEISLLGFSPILQAALLAESLWRSTAVCRVSGPNYLQ